MQSNWKITDIKGRTIHADGTIFPLTLKAEDLLIAKSSNLQANKKVFTLPNVEVGSILEYYYEIHYDDNRYSSPDWRVHQSYSAPKARHEFTAETDLELVDQHGRIIRRLLWWPQLPSGIAVQSRIGSKFTLNMTDIPPAPDEESDAAHRQSALPSGFLLYRGD